SGLAGGVGSGSVGVWVVSGSSEGGLRGQASRLHEFLVSRPGISVGDVGVSLAGRAALAHRAVVVGRDRDGLLAGLGAVARGESGDGVIEGRAAAGGGVVFVFAGQGGQWPGMAVELWDQVGVFREQMEACEQVLGGLCDWRLGEVLRDGDALDRVDVVQPVLFAVMVGLAAVWRSVGVEPVGVLGHSQGEMAAAFVAGALSLEDAARVVVARSRAISEVLSGQGGMVALAASVDRARELVEGLDGVGVAAVNGPGSVVVSGESDALERLVGVCEAGGVRARVIPVDYASHSVAVDAVRERLLSELSGVSAVSSQIPFYSATTGGRLDTAALDGGYWYRNLREPVQFEQATKAALGDSVSALVEIGPHPVLALALGETIEATTEHPGRVVVLGSLRRTEGVERLVSSIAEAHVHGVGIGWGGLLGSGRGVDLPTYAFQRQRFWLGFEGTVDDQVRTDALPLILQPLTPTSQQPAQNLQHQLATAPQHQWGALTHQLVIHHTAQILGHASHHQIDPTIGFKDLGLDSVGAITLRNQLARASRLALPQTLLFENPTPVAVAQYLLASIEGSPPERPGDRSAAPDLDREALPDETIWARHSTSPRRQAESALLTGATGFLGIHLLANLLERLDGPIRCVVRAPNANAALQRLNAAAETYLGESAMIDCDRIIPLAGDLAQPQLGLSTSQLADLADATSMIIHAGAEVNHIYPYSELRAANVNATHELLRLASAAEPIPFHFVSTLGAVDPGAAARAIHVCETAFLLSADVPLNGYLQSKWVADRLVINARSRGLTSAVYRPGLILGHSVTGACNTKDTIWRLLRLSLRLGAFPAGEASWYAAPVDFVSKAITELALSTTAPANQAYHLINPQPLRDTDLYEWVADFGYELEEVSVEEWRDRLSGLARASCDPEIEAATALIEAQANLRGDHRAAGGDPAPQVSYECAHAGEHLGQTAMVDRAALQRSVHATLRYLADTGSIPPVAEIAPAGV
ncbi:MAG: thioester reductase domain-containing protein, partial [Solirubrobacteraceae bacterium]